MRAALEWEINVASRSQLTGMRGVFLVAAELSARGLIVTTTSRNAMGADLLVTDQECRKTWSIQVKTNRKPSSFWLVGEKALTLVSASHVYVLVNLRPSDGQHEYFVVPSREVTKRAFRLERKRSTFFVLRRVEIERYRDRWKEFAIRARG